MSITTRLPSSACCECGYQMDACSGHSKPSPGDLSLCVRCGSLNFFDDDLRLRRPTDDELFEAAKDPTIQRMRRAIMRVQREVKRR